MMTIACSPLPGHDPFSPNIAAAYTHAAIAAGLLLVSVLLWLLLNRFRAWPVIIAAIVVLHPAWTVSPYDGDCGLLKKGLAEVFTALACIMLAAQIVHAVRLRIPRG
jgi:hypothetical protein